MTLAERAAGRNTTSPGRRFSAGLLTAVSGNLLFIVLLGAGAAMRVIVLAAYRPALMLQRDTYVYLVNAFSDRPSGWRPILYSLLLRPLLAVGDVAIVPVVQHLAGLAVALVLFLVLRRAGVGPNVAALGVAPVLLDGYQLIIEHYVLTEAFFQLLVVAAMGLLAWRARPAVPAVAAAGLLLSLAGLTRFIGVVLIGPALLYLALRRMGWLRAGVLVTAFVLPLGVYGMWFQTSSGPAGITNRNGYFLFGRVVELSDCSGLRVPGPERPLCDVAPPAPGAPTGVFALDLPAAIERSPRANSLLSSFSRRMIMARPGAYAAAVTKDFLRYFEARPPQSQEPNVKRWRFPRSLDDADPKPVIRARDGGPPPGLGLQGGFTIDRPLASGLRSYQAVVYTYGPLLAALALLGLAGAVAGAPLGARRGSGPVCALLVLSGLVLLLGPVMTTVYHFRYVLAPLPLLGAGGAAGAAVIWNRLQHLRL